MHDIYDNDFDKAFDEAVDAVEKKEHRLIWADALKKAMEHRLVCYPLYAKMPLAYGDTDIFDIIDAQPTVGPTASTCLGCNCPKMEKLEAEPKHGRWIEIDKYHLGTCSVCGDRWGSIDMMHYCPHCGSKMDDYGEDVSHPFAESVMMGMDGEENDQRRSNKSNYGSNEQLSHRFNDKPKNR